MNKTQKRDPKTGKFVGRSSPVTHKDDDRRIADFSDEFFDEVPRDADCREEDKGICIGCAVGAIAAFIIVAALLTL